MKTLRNSNGQFTPITAMIAFSVVIFMVAVVNIYTITRAKLRMQNIADAAALNLASQTAQALNMVADRNEWLNHMLAGVPSPSDENAPPEFRDCGVFSMQHPTAIPGISCIENPFAANDPKVYSRHIFYSRDGAINYASVIQTVNEAQLLFIQAYNSFLGYGGSTSNSSISARATHFQGLLENDIPELKEKGKVHLIAWNTASEPSMTEIEEFNKDGNLSALPKMAPLRFKVDHDIMTAYTYSGTRRIDKKTLSEVLYDCISYNPGNSRYGRCGPLYGQTKRDVGWLVPDDGNMPKIQVNASVGSGVQPNQPRYGVGVAVSENIHLPVVGSRLVTARAKAYVVNDSGVNTNANGSPSVIPRFKPTYWVKLAN